MKKTIWMFSGQGSQLYQMGRELYEKEPVFRSTLEQGDAIIANLINESLLKIIYAPRENRFEPFRHIRYTHPAILLIEFAAAEMLLSRGFKPDSLLGYSLGELTALMVAGVIPFEETLISVTKQAALIEYLAPPGGMLAILDSPRLQERFPELFRDVEIAAHNFPNNFVVTGPTAALTRLQNALKQHEINTVELPVDHPFHSRAMSCLDRPFQLLLNKMTLRPAAIPVYSAQKPGAIFDPSDRQLLDGTRHRVDLAAAINHLEKESERLYIDLGPAGSMATAVKYNLAPGSKSEFFPILTPFGHDLKNLDRLTQRLRA